MALLKTPITSTTLGLDWAAALSANDARIGNAIDLDTTKVIALGVHYELGRSSGTAYTNAPRLRVQLSDDASGSDWAAASIIQPSLGASIANTTLNGAVSAGATSITVTANTNMTAGEMLFIGDASTANYEIAVIKSISGTTINLEDALTNGHSNGATVTGQAERGYVTIDTTAARRARIVIDTENIVGGGLYSRVACVVTSVS